MIDHVFRKVRGTLFVQLGFFTGLVSFRILFIIASFEEWDNVCVCTYDGG